MQRKGGGVLIIKRLIEYAPAHNYTTLIAFDRSSYKEIRNNDFSEKSFFTLPRHFRFGFGRLTGIITICCLDFLAIISLVRLIKKYNPDIIHLTAHGVCFPITVLAARICKKKIVISVHDLWHFTVAGYIPKKFANIIFKRCIKRLDTVFVISSEMANYFSRKYGEKKYHVIHDGIANVQFKSYYPFVDKNISFLYVGILYPIQYSLLQTFLKAVSSINNKNFDIGICSNTNFIIKTNYANININNHGWLNEDELKHISKEYSYGLLPQSFDKKDELLYRTSLMTKIPFYIRMGLPIIGIGPSSSSSIGLIERDKIGIAITSDKEGVIKNAVRELISNKQYSTYLINLRKSADTTFNISYIHERFYKNLP